MYDAPVHSLSLRPWGTEITLALPTGSLGNGAVASAAGRFFMARANDGDESTRTWDPYLRLPLFPVAVEPRPEAVLWSFLVQGQLSTATRWLAARRPGDSVNLLGPFGNGFVLRTQSRTLLLVADADLAPLLFPLIHPLLDGSARVTLLLRVTGERAAAEQLVRALPLAVEARLEAADGFDAALASLLAWADQVCLCLRDADLAQIARAVRARRLRLDAGFAQLLTLPALPCGVGACLACLVPLANGGFTRACVHGPVFDLTRLTS